MKTAFRYNGANYLSPTKREAVKFLRFYGENNESVYRFVTNWKFRTVEKAPSYCQVMKIMSGKVEFEMI